LGKTKKNLKENRRRQIPEKNWGQLADWSLFLASSYIFTYHLLNPMCVWVILVIWHFHFASLTIYFTFIRHQDILIFVFVGRQKNIASPKTIIWWSLLTATQKKKGWIGFLWGSYAYASWT